MADQVEEIKQKADIVGLIGEKVELKKAGRNFKALCPFHSEKTPSFMVSPELQIYKCFGCGKSGDVYSFLMDYEGMEFFEALKFLADRTGVVLKRDSYGNEGRKRRLFELSEEILKFYRYMLLAHPIGGKALSYLKKNRGFDEKTIKVFSLGFAPSDSRYLKKYILEKKGYKEKEVEDVGVFYLAKDYATDRFRGRVIFPLTDHRDNVVGFAGRVLPDDEKKDLAKYINSPETEIYHKSKILYGLNLAKKEIRREEKAVIVEGEIDAITSWQAGVKNAVAVKGSALTEDQARLLSRFSKNVILALDTDIAGNSAARRGVEILDSLGFEVKVADLGEYKDPDEMVRKNPLGFKEALKSAEGAWDYIINSIFGKYDAKSSDGKRRIESEILPLLSLIGDEIILAHYVNIVAERLSVPYEAVHTQLGKVKAGKRTGVKIESEIVTEKSDRRKVLEERYLTIAFQKDPEILLSRKKFLKGFFAKKIIDKLKSFMKDRKKFDAARFGSILPGELKDGFSKLILSEVEVEILKNYKEELENIVSELAIFSVREKLIEMEGKLKSYELVGNNKGLEKANARFAKLISKLKELEEGKRKSIIF